MTKSKDRSEAEYLRGIVRQLKSENRNLKKQLGLVSKKNRQYENNLSDHSEFELEEMEEEFIEAREKCPKCKADIEVLEIGNRDVRICKDCGYRSSRKKR